MGGRRIRMRDAARRWRRAENGGRTGVSGVPMGNVGVRRMGRTGWRAEELGIGRGSVQGKVRAAKG